VEVIMAQQRNDPNIIDSRTPPFHGVMDEINALKEEVKNLYQMLGCLNNRADIAREDILLILDRLERLEDRKR
jgi:hypothetical protein